MQMLEMLCDEIQDTLVEYMEKKLGVGWWGSDAYATYYEESDDDENDKSSTDYS